MFYGIVLMCLVGNNDDCKVFSTKPMPTFEACVTFLDNTAVPEINAAIPQAIVKDSKCVKLHKEGEPT